MDEDIREAIKAYVEYITSSIFFNKNSSLEEYLKAAGRTLSSDFGSELKGKAFWYIQAYVAILKQEEPVKNLLLAAWMEYVASMPKSDKELAGITIEVVDKYRKQGK